MSVCVVSVCVCVCVLCVVCLCVCVSVCCVLCVCVSKTLSSEIPRRFHSKNTLSSKKLSSDDILDQFFQKEVGAQRVGPAGEDPKGGGEVG